MKKQTHAWPTPGQKRHLMCTVVKEGGELLFLDINSPDQYYCTYAVPPDTEVSNDSKQLYWVVVEWGPKPSLSPTWRVINAKPIDHSNVETDRIWKEWEELRVPSSSLK